MGFLDHLRPRTNEQSPPSVERSTVSRLISDRRVQVGATAAALLAGIVAIGSRFLPQQESSPEYVSQPGVSKNVDVESQKLFPHDDFSCVDSEGHQPYDDDEEGIDYPVLRGNTLTHEGTLEDSLKRIVDTLRKYVYPEIAKELEDMLERYKKDKSREKLDEFMDRVEEILRGIEDQLEKNEQERLREKLRRVVA